VQAPLHALNWAAQVNVHAPAAHFSVPLGTAGHLTLHPPQWFTLVSGSTHSAPHASGAPAVQPFEHWKVGPMGAHIFAVAGQTALHAPQLVACERSTSQPSAGFALQSAYPGVHEATTHARAWHPIVACADGQGAQLGSPQP
jgi:hypothetical protein